MDFNVADSRHISHSPAPPRLSLSLSLAETKALQVILVVSKKLPTKLTELCICLSHQKLAAEPWKAAGQKGIKCEGGGGSEVTEGARDNGSSQLARQMLVDSFS